MVKIFWSDNFQNIFSNIKDPLLKNKIVKQIEKIKQNPGVGKPMRYEKKGTRELYIKPFRLAYVYLPREDRIVLFDLYHKKRQ